MIIAQLTDLHIRADDLFCHGISDSSRGLKKAIDRLIKMTPGPDVVLISGDLADDKSLEAYYKVRNELARLKIPVFVVPGNHDDRKNLTTAFRDHTYLPSNGPLHYAIESFPLRLIGLDTLIPGAIGGQLCEKRLRWLEERLSEQPDQPTLLFMHHTPFRTGIPGLDIHQFDGATELKQVLAKHPQVEALVSGHVHRIIFKKFGNVLAVTSPATSYQFTLSLTPEPDQELTKREPLTAVLEPPGFLVHVWSKDDGLTTHISYLESYVGPVPLGA